MHKQINVRLPEKLLVKSKTYAKKQGYGTLQELIKECLREKVFEDISPKELSLVKKLIKLGRDKNHFGTEKELFAKLDR